MNLGLFSSKTDEWETPKGFFDQINDEFNFDIDLCATLENAKCPRFITKADDFITCCPWEWDKPDYSGKHKIGWMNPPYGRKISEFMRKAYECYFVGGMTVVCLVPARTDTSWWHDYVQDRAEVRFIKGRLKFGDSKNSAPFPSALVIYNPKINRKSK